MLWSDKKIFVVDQRVNRKNRRPFLAKKGDINLQAAMRMKHPASVMVFGLMATDGNVMPPLFVDRGVKINVKVYHETILPEVEAWCKATYGARWKNRVCLMQDGAPCHTAKSVQAHLAENWGQEAFWPG